MERIKLDLAADGTVVRMPGPTPFVHGPALGLASRERFVDKPQTPALSEFPSPS
jgi:hypothetical protein